MDARVKQFNQSVKVYDRKLFVVRVSNGMIQIHREGERLEDSDLPEEIESRRPFPQLILCLTDDWTLQGQPVEWGLEPVLKKLRSMDSWTQERIFKDLYEERERNQKTKQQSRKNEYRAIAMDMRKDFARATNDINTSTL